MMCCNWGFDFVTKKWGHSLHVDFGPLIPRKKVAKKILGGSDSVKKDLC